MNTPSTNVTILFAEWKRLRDCANETQLSPSAEKAAEVAVDNMGIIKKSMLAMPSLSMQDLAAKVVVSTDYGSSLLDDEVANEAQAILSNARSKTVPASVSFDLVCAMEEHMTVIEDMLNALGIICLVPDLTDNESDSTVIQRLSWIAKDHLKAIEKLRGDLWDINHPGRGRDAANGIAERQEASQ